MSHDYKSSSPITSTSTRCFTAVSLNEHAINMFPRKLMYFLSSESLAQAMRMRSRGLSGPLATSSTSKQAATLQGGPVRAAPGGGARGENVARGGAVPVPGRLPGFAARRKGVLEPDPPVLLPKPSAPVTGTNTSLGRGCTKTVARTKHLPPPLKLATNNVAPLADPETASSAPTTPWQLPCSTSSPHPPPDQLAKFPHNNDVTKMFKTQQPSTPTQPKYPQDLVTSTTRQSRSENQQGNGSLELAFKESASATSPMAVSPQSNSETSDLSSLKSLIQVFTTEHLMGFMMIRLLVEMWIDISYDIISFLSENILLTN